MPFCTPANLLTLCRIPLALFLLFVAPLSPAFFLFYVLAGITDMLDGPLARRSHTANRTGAWLDSLADTVFLAAVLFRLLPAVTLPHWAPWALLILFLLRCAAWLVGSLKFRRFAALHTIANKVTGAALFCAPFLLPLISTDMLCIALCLLAGFSAAEELMIQVRCKAFDPNVRSIISLAKSAPHV